MGTSLRRPLLLALFVFLALKVQGGEGKLSEALTSSNPDERQGALRSLLDQPSDSPMDVPALAIRSCLYDEDLSVRLAAIAVLVHRKIPDFNADLMILLARGVTSIRSVSP